MDCVVCSGNLWAALGYQELADIWRGPSRLRNTRIKIVRVVMSSGQPNHSLFLLERLLTVVKIRLAKQIVDSLSPVFNTYCTSNCIFAFAAGLSSLTETEHPSTFPLSCNVHVHYRRKRSKFLSIVLNPSTPTSFSGSLFFPTCEEE